ncbi:MAG: MBL fold metallo-hydrolase [Leptospirales bacterium]|nr:MBL fold metallo-hydrolase [Leptospirales bacterium]
MKKQIQITSNIFLIGGSGESASNDAAIYLIKNDDISAIVDAGSGDGTKAVLENIKRCGVELSDIAYIFVTHCHFDHTGGINSLRKATGARVVMHQMDAGFVSSGDAVVTAAKWYGARIDPTPIEIIVSEKKKDFPLGKLNVTMHHIPGHSPGSAAFTLYSDDQLVLFGQDVHGPIDEAALRSNRDEYKKSLEFLASLNADILCEGHYGVYFGKDEVRRFIRSFI